MSYPILSINHNFDLLLRGEGIGFPEGGISFRGKEEPSSYQNDFHGATGGGRAIVVIGAFVITPMSAPDSKFSLLTNIKITNACCSRSARNSKDLDRDRTSIHNFPHVYSQGYFEKASASKKYDVLQVPLQVRLLCPRQKKNQKPRCLLHGPLDHREKYFLLLTPLA